jgi:hypothetical protein
VNATQQQASGLAGQLRVLKYPRRTEPHPGGADGDGTATSPDDQIVGPPNSGDSTVRLVDNITRGPLPQNPPPPPPPTPTSPSDDAITQLMLPPPTPTTTPASDPIRTWVDNMVRELAARPPDDPIAVEARRLAWEALHEPQQCSTWQWTRDAGGLLLSLGGAGVTIAGAPLGPADGAARGRAFGGDSMSNSFVLGALTVAGVAAIVGVAYSLRSAGRLNLGRYLVAVGVLGVLLAAFAIATAATGAWIWSLWAVAFLAVLALVAYRAVRRHGEKGSSDAELR